MSPFQGFALKGKEKKSHKSQMSMRIHVNIHTVGMIKRGTLLCRQTKLVNVDTDENRTKMNMLPHIN